MAKQCFSLIVQQATDNNFLSKFSGGVRRLKCPLHRWNRSEFHTERRSTCNSTRGRAADISRGAAVTLGPDWRRKRPSCWARRDSSTCISSQTCMCRHSMIQCPASASRRTETAYSRGRSAVPLSRTSPCSCDLSGSEHSRRSPSLKRTQYLKYS